MGDRAHIPAPVQPCADDTAESTADDSLVPMFATELRGLRKQAGTPHALFVVNTGGRVTDRRLLSSEAVLTAFVTECAVTSTRGMPGFAKSRRSRCRCTGNRFGTVNDLPAR